MLYHSHKVASSPSSGENKHPERYEVQRCQTARVIHEEGRGILGSVAQN